MATEPLCYSSRAAISIQKRLSIGQTPICAGISPAGYKLRLISEGTMAAKARARQREFHYVPCAQDER
jgi:hypothetical protein